MGIMEEPQKRDMYLEMLQEYNEINARSRAAIREVENRNIPYDRIFAASLIMFSLSSISLGLGVGDIAIYFGRRRRQSYSISNSTS